MKNIFRRHILILAVVSTTAFFACNTTKKINKAEDNAIAIVKNSNRATSALQGYFMQKYRCINDTITTVIKGDTVTTIDTFITTITSKAIVVNDTVFVHTNNKIEIHNNKVVRDTLILTVKDQKQINYLVQTLDEAKNSLETIKAENNQTKDDLKLEKSNHTISKILIVVSWLLFMLIAFLYQKLKNNYATRK